MLGRKQMEILMREFGNFFQRFQIASEWAADEGMWSPFTSSVLYHFSPGSVTGQFVMTFSILALWILCKCLQLWLWVCDFFSTFVSCEFCVTDCFNLTEYLEIKGKQDMFLFGFMEHLGADRKPTMPQGSFSPLNKQTQNRSKNRIMTHGVLFQERTERELTLHVI